MSISDTSGNPKMQLHSMATIKTRPHAWWCKGWLLHGSVRDISGYGGVNKSTYTCYCGARISKGRGLLPDDPEGEPRDVIIVSAEDDYAADIKPRLQAEGADMARVHFIENHNLLEIYHGSPTVRRLNEMVRDIHAGYVVIDPMYSYLADHVDSNLDAKMRRALQPIAEMSRETGCATDVIRHFNKDSKLPAQLRGTGSNATGNFARIQLVMVEDPNDPEKRVLSNVKVNAAKHGQCLSFKVEEVSFPAESDPTQTIETCRLVYQGAAAGRIEDYMRQGDGSHRGQKLTAAVEFLQRTIPLNAPYSAEQLYRDGREVGLSEWSVKEALKRCLCTYDGNTKTWALPRVSVNGHTVTPPTQEEQG